MDIQKRLGTKRKTAAAAAAALVLALGLSAAPALAEESPLETVGFGGKEWLVVGGKEGTRDVAANEGALTLLAKDLNFGTSGFGENGRYQGSTLQSAMAAAAGNLDPSEQALIKRRTLQPSSEESEGDDGIAGDPAENQLFWPLSKAEHDKLDPAEYIKWESLYWLRTYERTEETDGVYVVFYSSYSEQTIISPSWFYLPSREAYLRPALWLDLSSALFTTAAKGGKVGADENAALPGYTPPEDDYKFTMEDDLAPDFAPDGLVSRRGRTLTVSYSDAEYAEGKTRFLSALVRRGGDAFYGNVTHYGRLKEIGSTEDESGSVEVTLPEGFDPARDTLYLFVEQSNGDNHTDFAGTPLALDLAAPSVGSVTPSGTDAPVSGSLVLTFSEPMDTAHGTAALSGGSGAAEKSVTWSEGGTVCTLPYSGLAHGTDYTVRISGFRDRAGNVMADDSSHTFRTAAEPAEENPPAEEAPPGGSNSGNSGNSGSSGGSGAVYSVLAQFGAWSGVPAQAVAWGGGPVTARIDADHTKFTRLLCDGAEVDPAHYTVTQGSTVITLRESYLATLSEGSHTLVAEYTDGRSGGLTLAIGSSPKTGEDGGPVPAAAIALLALLAFLGAKLFLTSRNFML